MADESSERSLQPVPWHVELTVFLITNPGAAAVILGIPFALTVYALASLQWLPFVVATGSPAFNAYAAWMAASAVWYVLLSRPY